MEIIKLSCPACGANIQMDLNGKNTIFCPFCGSQIAIDDGSITITKNVNINKRYTDEAKLERERLKDKQNEREHKEYKGTMIGVAIFLILDIIFLGYMYISSDWKEKKAIESGMIQIGQSSSEIKGEKYTVILKKLEANGFNNIETVDLDDSDLFKRKNDTIESITINGDASFESDDYFAPDSKIIITFH